ncbi:unnamed protein product [Triticum turgidum subsp. durum]|uniref:Uncharacterized protein n=1 Tax=Triticum turgidum subsp. durum TaxID=4567 RepID=A0A9R1NTW9_TRITD|nr:unnamed protein product [Triticum turgidum subsp. durum]
MNVGPANSCSASGAASLSTGALGFLSHRSVKGARLAGLFTALQLVRDSSRPARSPPPMPNVARPARSPPSVSDATRPARSPPPMSDATRLTRSLPLISDSTRPTRSPPVKSDAAARIINLLSIHLRVADARPGFPSVRDVLSNVAIGADGGVGSSAGRTAAILILPCQEQRPKTKEAEKGTKSTNPNSIGSTEEEEGDLLDLIFVFRRSPCRPTRELRNESESRGTYVVPVSTYL